MHWTENPANEVQLFEAPQILGMGFKLNHTFRLEVWRKKGAMRTSISQLATGIKAIFLFLIVENLILFTPESHRQM